MVFLNKTIVAHVITMSDDKSNVEIDQTEEVSSYFYYSLKIPL
jgi:hypothetical protein